MSSSELLKVTLEDHRWLLKQFCRIIVPLYCALVFISQFLENFETISEFLLSRFFPFFSSSCIYWNLAISFPSSLGLAILASTIVLCFIF